MNADQVFTFQIEPVLLGATAGMMLENGPTEVAQEFSRQVRYQIYLAGVSFDEVLSECDIPVMDFAIPPTYVLIVCEILTQLVGKYDDSRVEILMGAWKPALEIIANGLDDDAYPFDRYGNCMN
jgi:hypothetical protein